MTPHSYRISQHGFTVLEAMIALGVVVVVITTTYSLSFGIRDREVDTLIRLEATQLARSLYEELSVDPNMPLRGQVGTLVWSIEMGDRPVNTASNSARQTLYDVQISISDASNDTTILEKLAVVARP